MMLSSTPTTVVASTSIVSASVARQPVTLSVSMTLTLPGVLPHLTITSPPFCSKEVAPVTFHEYRLPDFTSSTEYVVSSFAITRAEPAITGTGGCPAFTVNVRGSPVPQAPTVDTLTV